MAGGVQRAGQDNLGLRIYGLGSSLGFRLIEGLGRECRVDGLNKLHGQNTPSNPARALYKAS